MQNEWQSFYGWSFAPLGGSAKICEICGETTGQKLKGNMSDEALLSEVASNADAALKICKGAWERGTLGRAEAERLEAATRLAHFGATELLVRAKAALPAETAGS